MKRHSFSAGILLAVLASIAGASAAAPSDLANRQVQAAPFDPKYTAYPTFTDGARQWQVVRTGNWPLHVTLSQAGRADVVFELPHVLEQVSQLRTYKDRLIVEGWMNSARAADVAVFDLNTRQMIDEFWCYDPVVSPDGSRIAFVKFYPSHFVDNWEDQEMVYQVDASPRQNRPAVPSTASETGSSKASIKVGWPIYPLAAAELGRSNSSVSGGDTHHKLSHFVWSADSRRVGFLDAQSGRVSLIVNDTAALAPLANVSIYNPALSGTSAVALPALEDWCDARSTPAPSCVEFAYDSVRLTMNEQGVTVVAATADQPPQTRTLHVEPNRLQQVMP